MRRADRTGLSQRDRRALARTGRGFARARHGSTAEDGGQAVAQGLRIGAGEVAPAQMDLDSVSLMAHWDISGLKGHNYLAGAQLIEPSGSLVHAAPGCRDYE